MYCRCVWHHIRLGLDLSKLRTHTYNTDPISSFIVLPLFHLFPPPPSPASVLPLPCSHRAIHALPQASTTLTHALIKGYLGSADPSPADTLSSGRSSSASTIPLAGKDSTSARSLITRSSITVHIHSIQSSGLLQPCRNHLTSSSSRHQVSRLR